MLKMPLFDITAKPLLAPAIAKYFAVPLSILGYRQASDQEISEAKARQMAFEGFQDIGSCTDLREVMGRLDQFKD